MRSQGPYFVFNQEELKVLGQDGWLTGEELRTGSYARGFVTPEGAREAQVALPLIEQSGTCIIRHKTLVKLQEFPETFNISYGEEASCQVQKEMDDKQLWLDKYYPSITERLLVSEDKSKADTILQYCKDHDISLQDVVFVDDTIPFLREAERKGIISFHISSFLDWDFERRQKC